MSSSSNNNNNNNSDTINHNNPAATGSSSPASTAAALATVADDNQDDSDSNKDNNNTDTVNHQNKKRSPPSKPWKQKNKYKKRKTNPKNKNNKDNQDGNDDDKNEQQYTYNSRKSRPVHPGSYAAPEYRRQFGVELPCLERALQEVLEQQQQDQQQEAPKEVGGGEQQSPQQTKEPPGDGEPQQPPQSNEPQHRVKRKYAFLLGYLGQGYGGFQINPGTMPTVQAEFELALYRGGFLTARNFGHPVKYSWSTSGRTDKGVHACAQVGSAKLHVTRAQERDVSLMVHELNRHLTRATTESSNDNNDDGNKKGTLRVLDVARVTNGFCAHTQRDRVRYQYLIPAFVLQKVHVVRDLFAQVTGGVVVVAENQGHNSSNDNDNVNTNDNKTMDTEEQEREPPSERPASDPFTPDELEQLKTQMKGYRCTPEQLALLKEALHSYEGTHSFHNYSKGVKSDEARSNRFIVSFHVEDPIVFDDDGTQWIPTQVLGQSFLLHQIRKMICMAVDVARGATPLSTLQKGLLRKHVIRVAPAPAQGLFLEMSYYTGYNQRKQRSNPDLPNLEWHDATKNAAVYQRWHDFRNGVLMPHLVEEERREGNFIKWLYQHEFLNDYQTYYQMEEDGDDNGTPAEETTIQKKDANGAKN